MIAEDLTARLNLLFKNTPWEEVGTGLFPRNAWKGTGCPMPPGPPRARCDFQNITAKDGSSVQVCANGSVALKFVADNTYRSSACNAAMGGRRCILLVGWAYFEKELMSNHVKMS